MKLALFMCLLVASASLSFADCGDPTFSPHDKEGDVKKKLTCFAEENAKLKQEVANAQSKLGQLQIQWGDRKLFRRQALPVDTCKTRAIDSLVKRGGVILEQGDTWVDFALHD